MRMKRWESPRREGRNDKGKKNSARQRQIKKQTQVWRKKLKGDAGPSNPGANQGQSNNEKKERYQTAPFFVDNAIDNCDRGLRSILITFRMKLINTREKI
jgi:hypothetical protein